ncbi:hypothetical protein N7510_001372 [Penicillium lagena]|uniref:uncharacterized protein n=1 Tax=Penicillium lagena TaxID=94218 RepID=UPI00253F759C|nr:uncharacterized protein N7510_001372 [Penicillium lagena]KAJ5625063.1 hypothetical protein N7510_001372 [Penicillium lagena]
MPVQLIRQATVWYSLLLLSLTEAIPPDSASNPNRIWDNSAASSYGDNYPIGNGRVGAMVGGARLQRPSK